MHHINANRSTVMLRQEARGKRQEARGKRQEARGKRQEARGKRQEARGKISLTTTMTEVQQVLGSYCWNFTQREHTGMRGSEPE
jgi:uncharacterized protein YjbJ (UPF0337 family)